MLFGTTDERTDYICGIAWLGIILAALFALWILVILIFCALGSKRVGFLSGKRFQRTYYYVNSSGKNVNMSGDMDDAEEPIYKNGGNSFMKPTMSSGNRSSDDDDDVYIENDTNKPNGQAYHSTPPNHGRTIPTNHETAVVGGGVKCCCWDQAVWIRGIFILSAVIFIIFSILLVTEGLTNLQGTIDSVSKSSYDIRETSTKTQGIVDVVLGIQANSTGLRQTLETELKDENLCPANPDLSQGQPTQTIKSLATSALEWLNQLNAYSESSDLKSLSASLESSSNAADNVYFQTKDVDISDWESLMILIPHTIIPCLLAAKAIMAAFDTPSQIFHCITAWVLVPLFVLMVISSAIISSAIVMVASSNSDFCYPEQYTVNPTSLVPNARQYNSIINSPDISVLQIIKNQGYDVNSTEYKGISFYILQCLQENPFGDVEKYVPTLVSPKRKKEFDMVGVLGFLRFGKTTNAFD